MPGTTRPHNDNKTVNLFTLGIAGSDIGDVTVGSAKVPKDNYDILNALVNRPKARIQFHHVPVIELVTVDMHYDNFALIAGTALTNISAGTTNLDFTIGFVIHEEKMSRINGVTYHSGVTPGVVLNSAASGAGTTYTEDDDYVVDSETGEVQCIPTGTHTLADGSTVYVQSGTYITQDSKRVKLQSAKIDTEIAGVTLAHTYSDAETLTLYLYKANIISDLDLNFILGGGGEFMGLPMTIAGLYDSTHATEEYGYLDVTTA